MPSPFPGMNPFLEDEDTWEDFHHRFMTHMADELAKKLGENYKVKVEMRLILHELSADERRLLGRADVGVSERDGSHSSAGAVALAPAPMSLQLPAVDIERESYLELIDRRNRRVVTVIELLSPANKNQHREDYLAKRRQIIAAKTNLVEIDLRRGGRRPTPPDLPACDYYVLISRGSEQPRLDFWPIQLSDPLPTIPVPLSEGDADVPFSLKQTLDQTYDAAGYDRYIYTENIPEPPLGESAGNWARDLIAKLQR